MNGSDLPLGCWVDVFSESGQGSSLAYLEAWQDDENAVVRFHGVGNQQELTVVPISRIKEAW